MLPLVLLCSALIAGQDPPRPPDDPKPPAKAEPPLSPADALVKYNGMRDKVAETGPAHWKMAQWCEQNGLRPEAYFHFGKVIELEPRREAAWIKLGFKKHDGRWMTAEQIVLDDAQKKADKDWTVKFKKWHKDIHGGGSKKADSRATVQAAFDAVVDPVAVPSIYREFCGGSAVDQSIGVQLLGQIDGSSASRVIAVMAVYGKSPTVRRQATETLRGRPSEDYLDILVSLMRDLLKYEVKPVGGPGSPGILFVEGEQYNARRFYAPPAPPNYVLRPGDVISYDNGGFPVIVRQQTSTGQVGGLVGVKGSKTLATERIEQRTTTETISLSAAYDEARRAAQSAQAQLANDIAEIDAINAGLHQFNELVMSVAQAATGKSPGRTAKDWRDLLSKQLAGRYRPRPQQLAIKPTFDEMVPLSYVPILAASVMMKEQTRFMTKTVVDT